MKKINSYKNIILDRDGIINEVIHRGNIISSPRNLSEFKYRDDFILFYKNAPKNISFYVFTNQPDVQRGLLNINELDKIHDDIYKKFNIKKIYFCPHDDSADCNCRKPLPGMINEIIDEFNIKIAETLVIGDSLKDIDAARSLGMDYCFLMTEYNENSVKKNNISFTVNALLELLL
tara:strand:- start:15840 stop:16367 length:528 start_codon:yes stop_codon:yes gene_type:complete